MSSILKVLKKIEKSDTQALHIEVPSEILKGLDIQPDGSVNLELLMQVCQRLARVKKLNSKINLAKQNMAEFSANSANSGHSEDLIDLIFNPDRVAEISLLPELQAELQEKS
jgi:hypothetical protein